MLKYDKEWMNKFLTVVLTENEISNGFVWSSGSSGAYCIPESEQDIEGLKRDIEDLYLRLIDARTALLVGITANALEAKLIEDKEK